MSRSRRARLRGDGGAVMAETALALPVILLLVFGVVEFSFAWRADNRLDSATANGARSGAAAGSSTYADRDVLVSILASLPPDLAANLDRVVIYKSTTANGAVPTNCVPAFGNTSNTGVNGSCNSYSGQFVRSVSTSTTAGFGGSAGDNDRYWAPSTRKDTVTGPPDYLGVYVRTTYADRTGTFWSDIRLTDTAVFRVQPDFTGF